MKRELGRYAMRGPVSFFVVASVGALVFSGCIGVSATKPGETTANLQMCAGAVVPAPDGLIDDFEDGDNKTAAEAGRGGYWWKSADSAGSFFGPDDWGPIPGGPDGSLALHPLGETVTGDPTEAWGAQIGGNLVGAGFYDASAYVGLSFWAKVGPKSTKTLRLQLADVNTHPTGEVCTNGCWNHFGKSILLTTEWQHYTVLFTDLRQEDGWGNPRPKSVTPTQLYSVGFKIAPGSPFEFMLDDLTFLACE